MDKSPDSLAGAPVNHMTHLSLACFSSLSQLHNRNAVCNAQNNDDNDIKNVICLYIYIYDSCLLIYLIDVYKKCISIPHFPPSIPMIYGSLILFQDQVLEVNGDMVNGDDIARKLENESQVQNRCRHRSGYGAATGFENQGYGSKNKTRKTKHLKGH